MPIFAYLYQDLTWEIQLESTIWGWEVDKVYQDLDWRRSQLDALLQDCHAHPPDFLLLMRLEDLGESLTQVTQHLTQLEDLGICILAIEQTYQSPCFPQWQPHSPQANKAGVERSPSPSSQLLVLLDAIQAEQRSRRIRHGHAQNRIKRRPPPGKAPYGYRRGKDRYVIDRTVSPVVKDFFEHFLLYGSLRGSVRYIAKKHGKKISVSTGRRWLTNPVYRGDLTYQNQQVVMDTHTPLLSREEAAQVDRLLRRNRSLTPRAASAPRSLSGIVFCATCQSPMTISRVMPRGKGKEYLYLRPTKCPDKPRCQAISYDKILQKTIQSICDELPQAVAGVNQPILSQFKQGVDAEIAAKQKILSQLPELVEINVLDQSTADLRAYNLQTEIAELKSRLAQLPPVNLKEIAQTVSIDQFWMDLSESERRFYFREFIRQVDLIRVGKECEVKLNFMF
ncbi:recombinase family protein [Acaryochloris sp. IP29b_bin.148]|uniref:recombinase family protein n=1 Tax=Acaryochloris sp. IP29b_bin.148 TaxID=2969218 RepID=UPI00261127D8|nr:recombinase family protein [Acaryochloris sp. IP29b_bin.148]